MMKKLLGASALAACVAVAAPASAQTTYNVTFGTALNAQITVAPGTGSRAVTSITGTFLGAAITGLIANPYSPATAYYYQITQVPQPTNAYPVGQTGSQNYYSYDNLLLAGNVFDSDGLLFTTSANVANLYTSGTTQLIYSPVGVNTPATPVSGTFAITAVNAAVPEPATWAMMIGGFGVVGFALRARRKVKTRVAFAA